MNVKPLYFGRQANQAEEELSPEAVLVRNTLIELGLETPMIETGLSEQQKY